MTVSRVPTNAVDHVGSLKRRPDLVQTWRDWEAGKVGFDVLREVQDRAIRDAVNNAGEARACRSSPTASFGAAVGRAAFLSAVEGFDFRASKLTFRNEDGFATPSPAPVATKRIRRTRPIVTEDFKFLHAAASKRVKVTMPTPSHMHFGQFKDAVDRNVYPDVEQYWDDMITVFHQEIDDLYAVGCRYLQLDEVPLALLCDPNIRALAKQRRRRPGPSSCGATSTFSIARSRGRPRRHDDCACTCAAATWKASGWAMAATPRLPKRCFGTVTSMRICLNTTRRAPATFAPLRHLPAGKRAYLGLISTKNPALESSDDLMRRLDEAAKYAPMDRLGICPQCGFASAAMSKFAVMPSKVTTDLQTLKIERLLEVGQRAWGHA